MLSQRLLLKLLHGERQRSPGEGEFQILQGSTFLWTTGSRWGSAIRRAERCAWQEAVAALGAMLQAQRAARPHGAAQDRRLSRRGGRELGSAA